MVEEIASPASKAAFPFATMPGSSSGSNTGSMSSYSETQSIHSEDERLAKLQAIVRGRQTRTRNKATRAASLVQQLVRQHNARRAVRGVRETTLAVAVVKKLQARMRGRKVRERGGAQRARALEDYTALSSTECSVALHELVLVHLDVPTPSGFIAVHNATTGATGVLPKDVLLVAEGPKARLLASFEADGASELSVVAGSVVTLLHTPVWNTAQPGSDEGWALVICGGSGANGQSRPGLQADRVRVGYVPEAFLQKIGANAAKWTIRMWW